jgi:endonuclease/exonuclease/phosphatase family metal-dependent hydrolase
VIRAQDADVVGLVEANDRDAVEALARRLGMEVAYAEANNPFSVACLSRLPIRAVANHRLPVLEKTLLEVELDGLLLFVTHLRAGRTEAAGDVRTKEAAAILHTIAGRECAIVGDFNAVHPHDEIGTPPPEERLEFVARRPIELFIEAGFVDCYRRSHPGERGWTYLTWHPWARLDYVLVSAEIAAGFAECDVVTSADARRASDHFPLVVTRT